MVLVDTSIWVRYLQTDSPLKLACMRAIEDCRSSGQTLCICAQVVIEFWAVASRPLQSNGLGMSAADVDSAVEDLLGLCQLLEEPSNMAARWRALARKYGPVGKPCHDLRLVALAEAHGIKKVLTLNALDFARFKEIEAVSPVQQS